MATLDDLCQSGVLVRLGGGLGPREQAYRMLLAYPHVVDWFENKLPGYDADFDEDGYTPLEQLDALVHDFVSGTDFSYYEKSHSMKPEDHGVWELKSPDLRLFGWFAQRSIFVIAEVDMAFRCKKHNLYPGYRDSVVRRRDTLQLAAPKYILGDHKDVL